MKRFLKPNVRLATSDPEPNQIQPILDGLQKVLQTVLDNQNQRPEVKIGETNASNSGGSKKKNSKPPSSVVSNDSNSTKGSDRRQNQGNDPSVRGRKHYQDFGQPRNWRSNSADSQYREPLMDQRQEPRHPIGIAVPHKMIDHHPDCLTLGHGVKRIVFLGGEVATFVGRETDTQFCIMAIQTPQDHLRNLALPHHVAPWRNFEPNSDHDDGIYRAYHSLQSMNDLDVGLRGYAQSSQFYTAINWPYGISFPVCGQLFQHHSVARQCLHCSKIDQPILWR